MKRQQIEELHRIAMADDEEVEPHTKVAAIRTSQQADKDQWERDNPELAGKTKGGGAKVDVNVNNQVGLFEMVRQAALAPPPDRLEEAKKRAAEEAKQTTQAEQSDPPKS